MKISRVLITSDKILATLAVMFTGAFTVMASKNPKTQACSVCLSFAVAKVTDCVYTVNHYTALHTYTHCVIKGRLWLGGWTVR